MTDDTLKINDVIADIVKNFPWRHRLFISTRNFDLDCCKKDKLKESENGAHMFNNRTRNSDHISIAYLVTK